MKITGKIKKTGAVVLTLILLTSGVAFSKVQASVGIEIDKSCSVTFQLDGTLEGEFGELNQLDIPVKLYKVADVEESGEYISLEGYEDLKLESISSETTAEEWSEKALKAVEIIENTEAVPTKEGIISSGSGKVEGLGVGMYLVKAETVFSDEYEYSFTPYLLSLPNNYYGTEGFEQDDSWVYDVITGLKPGRENRLGSLVIDKTLASYNATLGSTTFVFKVEGEKDGESVYSDVVSLVFDSAGTKSVTIQDLPAGATFTITEIYSGASYEVTSEPSKTVTIIADGEEGSPVHAAFSNDYNGQMNGGSSVVNHFTNNEGVWEWQQQTDSTGTQE